MVRPKVEISMGKLHSYLLQVLGHLGSSSYLRMIVNSSPQESLASGWAARVGGTKMMNTNES